MKSTGPFCRFFGLVASSAIVIVGCSSSSSSSDTAAPTVPVANGTIEAWQTLTPLTTPRANHCSVVIGDWLVVIGGNYKPANAKDFVSLDEVLAAKIADDGSIGDWTLAGKTPSAVTGCTATTDGKSLFLVDAIYADQQLPDPNAPPPVYSLRAAPFGQDGTLGAWTVIGDLPANIRLLSSVAVFDQGMIRAFDAKLPEEGNAISLVGAPLNGAAIGAWQDKSWFTGFRGRPQFVYADVPGAGKFVYTLGGYDSGDNGNTVLADGAGAALGPDGAPGASFPVSALPKPTSFGGAVSFDDWIFVVGGKDDVFAGKGRTDVFAAHIEKDGHLADFAPVEALPVGRTNGAVAASATHIYLTGGAYDAGGLNTVFGTRARFLPK